jgi:hypothetical protein
MRKYRGTNEPCTGDVVCIDQTRQAFGDAIIAGIDPDGTVHIDRPHIASDGGTLWGTSLKVERYKTTLDSLVNAYMVHTTDSTTANEKIDNRNRFPERTPAGRR